MKVILICQAAPYPTCDLRCNSSTFNEAIEKEPEQGIAPVPVKRSNASAYRFYTGTDRASLETAKALFESEEAPEQTPLLDEVCLRAFRETEKCLPLWVWQCMGTMQWYLGSKRQTESRKDTKQRASQLVDRLEDEERDCVLITRGLMLRTLRDELYRRGYCIEGGGLRLRPLDRIRATKQSLHCGGCIHNCLLSNPGCGIGMNKAKEQKISIIRRKGDK